MSSRYCSVYQCQRQASETQNGKPFCHQCLTQYARGLAVAASKSLEELKVLRTKILTIGLGGLKDE